MKRLVSLTLSGALVLTICPWMVNAATNTPTGSGQGMSAQKGQGNGGKTGTTSQSRMQECMKQGKSRQECIEMMKKRPTQSNTKNTNKAMQQNQTKGNPAQTAK